MRSKVDSRLVVPCEDLHHWPLREAEFLAAIVIGSSFRRWAPFIAFEIERGELRCEFELHKTLDQALVDSGLGLMGHPTERDLGKRD